MNQQTVIIITILVFILLLNVSSSKLISVIASVLLAIVMIKLDSNIEYYGGNNNVLAHIVNCDVDQAKHMIEDAIILSDDEFNNFQQSEDSTDNIIVVSKLNKVQIPAKLKYYCKSLQRFDVHSNMENYYSALNYDFVSLEYISTDIKEEMSKPNRLRLTPISKYNIRDVEKIKVTPEQEKYVSNPILSMMQCSIVSNFKGLAILSADKVIGLITYGDYIPPNSHDVKTKIYKYIIDETQQGKGYGKISMELLLKRLTGDVYLSVHEDNITAINMYTKAGFKKISTQDGSIIMMR